MRYQDRLYNPGMVSNRAKRTNKKFNRQGQQDSNKPESRRSEAVGIVMIGICSLLALELQRHPPWLFYYVLIFGMIILGLYNS